MADFVPPCLLYPSLQLYISSQWAGSWVQKRKEKAGKMFSAGELSSHPSHKLLPRWHCRRRWRMWSWASLPLTRVKVSVCRDRSKIHTRANHRSEPGRWVFSWGPHCPPRAARCVGWISQPRRIILSPRTTFAVLHEWLSWCDKERRQLLGDKGWAWKGWEGWQKMSRGSRSCVWRREARRGRVSQKEV